MKSDTVPVVQVGQNPEAKLLLPEVKIRRLETKESRNIKTPMTILILGNSTIGQNGEINMNIL